MPGRADTRRAALPQAAPLPQTRKHRACSPHQKNNRTRAARLQADRAAGQQRLQQLREQRRAVRAQQVLAQRARVVRDGGRQHVQRAQAQALLGRAQRGAGHAEQAQPGQLAEQRAARAGLQVLGQAGQLLQEGQAVGEAGRGRRRAAQRPEQRRQEARVGLQRHEHLHVVEQDQAGQRRERGVVQRARQHDVLQVAQAVGLVDLGAQAGVADRHHLLEHHALGQELAVPLPAGQLGVVLQRAQHVHHVLLGQQRLQQAGVVQHDGAAHDGVQVPQRLGVLQVLARLRAAGSGWGQGRVRAASFPVVKRPSAAARERVKAAPGTGRAGGARSRRAASGRPRGRAGTGSARPARAPAPAARPSPAPAA